ncbi:hypothetical protein [Photobacterium minamisatsumaniensis]|uniref:RHS repeat domain-containing protein n=1 Tax=Photobacterium minamisatsumaniensis TaxID=2910233 RepID=UPI003D0A9693
MHAIALPDVAIKDSPNKGVSLMLTSNAFNFIEYLDSGVDPRTGSYSATINTLQLMGNDLLGPNFSGNLSFSFLNDSDSGFGLGWSLPSGFFNKHTSQLTLTDGSSFQIRWNGALGRYNIPYNKLKNLRVYFKRELNTKDGEIFVYHADGEIEIYDYNRGTLLEKISSYGYKLTFDYYSRDNVQTLYQVSDEKGLTLHFDTWSNTWQTVISLWDHSQKISELTLYLSQYGPGKVLEYASLANQPDKYITFEYKYVSSNSTLLISACTYPTGLREEITYRDFGFHTAKDSPFETLPHVAKYRRDPGSSQPAAIHTYRYSDKNFLGFGGSYSYVAGEDTLFKENRDYRYWCEETINGNRTVFREYNKYHLQLKELVHHYSTLYQDVDFEYYCDESLSIDRQPPQYTFLKQKRTRLINTSERTLLDSFGIDEWGNEIRSVAANGTVVEHEYFHEDGEAHISASQHAFRNKIKKTLTYNLGGSAEEFNTQYFDYQQIATGSYDQLACLLKSERMGSTRIDYEYYTDPKDTVRFGRKKTEQVNINGQITRYGNDYQASKTYYQIVLQIHYFDGSNEAKYERFDKYTGNVIERQENEALTIKIQWSDQQRVIAEQLFHRGQFHSEVRYNTRTGKDQNRTTEIQANGMNLNTDLNNEGAEIRRSTVLEGWDYPLSSSAYNADGEKVTVTQYEHFDTNILELTFRLDYDIWGEIKSVIHPTGMVEHSVFDPIQNIQSRWVEGLNRRVQSFNDSDQLIQEIVYDSTGQQLYDTHNEYDERALLARTTTSLGAQIEYSYDVLERVIERRVHADGSVMTETYYYDPRFNEGKITAVAINGVIIAERGYDARGRTVMKRYNGCEYRYQNFDVNGHPQIIIEPAGRTRLLQYDEVNEQVIRSEVLGDTKSLTQFSYDDYGQRINDANANSDSRYTWDLLGNLKSITLSVLNQSPLVANFEHSLSGSLLNSSDFAATDTRYKFDEYGRPVITRVIAGQRTLVCETEFDIYSRPTKYQFSDDRNRAELIIDYGPAGQELRRQWRTNGKISLVIENKYDHTLRLIQRSTQFEEQYNHEQFSYDQLGRLKVFTVSGDCLPTDRWGNEILHQVFSYDEFNNIAQVITDFAQGASNTERYRYDITNPMRLVTIEHSRADFSNQEFEYDAWGNQTLGTDGIRLSYNSNDKVEAIHSSQKQLIRQYLYSAHDEQIYAKDGINSAQLFNAYGQLVTVRNDTATASLQSFGATSALRTRYDSNSVEFDLERQSVNGDHLGNALAPTQTKTYTPFGQSTKGSKL